MAAAIGEVIPANAQDEMRQRGACLDLLEAWQGGDFQPCVRKAGPVTELVFAVTGLFVWLHSHKGDIS